MEPHVSVEWRSDIEEGKRVGVQRVALTVSFNNVAMTVMEM